MGNTMISENIILANNIINAMYAVCDTPLAIVKYKYVRKIQNK